MRQSEINRIRDRAVAAAQECSCVDILRKNGFSTRQRGNQTYAQCYNCGKQNKFSVNTDVNMYHCFSCGIGGGPIKLYSQLKGLKYIDAALLIARASGDISNEEYDRATGTPDARQKISSDAEVFKKIEEKKAEEEAEYKAPPETTDLVYRHLLKLPEFALTEEAYRYLVNRRKLSDRIIKEVGFFSYSKGFKIEKLIESIKSEKPDFDLRQFVGVPGFYFIFADEKKKNGWWSFKNASPDCLGIPLRNSYGQIVAFQYRYMGEQLRDNKYFYLSSRNIKNEGKINGYGSSPGSPVSVCFPDTIENAVFYIGEGMFKMLELSKEGSVCFSCQGVQTFHYVADEAKECMKCPTLIQRSASMKGSREVSFCIVYDMDMYSKVQVVNAAVKTGNYLKKEFPGKRISLLLWRDSLGKGYDDMKFYCLNNGMDYHSKCRVVDFDQFESIVNEAVDAADETYFSVFGKKKDLKFRLTKEWKRYIYEELYMKRILPILPE